MGSEKGPLYSVSLRGLLTWVMATISVTSALCAVDDAIVLVYLFSQLKQTDGSGNEEREPDVLYQWQTP